MSIDARADRRDADTLVLVYQQPEPGPLELLAPFIPLSQTVDHALVEIGWGRLIGEALEEQEERAEGAEHS
jgi:hypothetical protein